VAVETSSVNLRQRLSCGLAPAVFLVLALSGCGGAAQTHQAVLRVTERDFRISAPKRSRSGDVLLSVHNRGPDAHELIVVRERGARLPLRRDGSTVSEERLEPIIVGTLEPGKPGSVRKLRLHLAPGRYELFCNMSGHYLGGMHTTLVVG
jgi:uncharacterized cupredoxin-like copper-binding protein